MYLINELHVARQLSGAIIRTCIDDLKKEVTDQNIEIMCYMVSRLMVHLCEVEMANANGETTKSALKEINLDYCDIIL